MKNKKRNYGLIIFIVIFGLLVFTTAYANDFNYTGIDLLKFAAIILIGSVAVHFARKNESIEQEFPTEDERTLFLKYKGGYYAGYISYYLWLFIFIFNDNFPYGKETILGAGILLSALISIVTRFYLKRKQNE